MSEFRTFITGVPRSGKTTLGTLISKVKDVPIVHCDDHIALGWSEASEHVAKLMEQDGSLVVEGVAVPRALRKFLAANPGKKPCDKLVVLHFAYIKLSKGQEIMGKGVLSVLAEVIPELTSLGVEVVHMVEE